MIRRPRPSNVYFVLILVMGYFLLFYQLFFQSGQLLSDKVEAKAGVWDLSGVDFSSGKLLMVEGECEFYWGQLLSPDDFSAPVKPKPSAYFKLPGVWNGYEVDGQQLTGNGYATFRLTVKVPQEGRYGIKIKEFDCAWRMWGNGEEIAVGTVGTSKEAMEPSWKREELYFTSKNKQIELVFQISNFHHRKGGPEDLMVFGTSKDLRAYKKSQLGISYFLIGILLIMGLHFLGLYIFRPVEKTALNFSLINFCILMRLATTNEKVFVDLLPLVDWELQIRIEYLAYMWNLPLFNAFFRSLYPQLFPKWMASVALWLTIATSLAVIVLPANLFTFTPLGFQYVIIIYTFVYLWRMLQAAVRHYQDAMVVLNGYLFVVFVALNDFLYYNRWIDTDFFLPLGLLVMVFTQSFVLSRRFSVAFESNEQLSRDLERYNAELEDTVRARTSEITAQKNEIEHQAQSLQEANKKLEELDVFKEQMTHMIAHDIKNPLNTIIGLSNLSDVPEKDRIIEQAGKDILHLVGNMLDVAKFQQTGIELNPVNVRLFDVVKSAVKQCAFMALRRDVRFEWAVDSGLVVCANPDMLERVVVNLLSNAIKFSPIKGRVAIESHLRDNGFVQLKVTDQGPGIRPHLRDRVFDQYFSQSQQSGPVKSTGLGLAFCKLAIEAHGGAIWVGEDALSGTEICFTLPLENNGAEAGWETNWDNLLVVTSEFEPIDRMWLRLFENVKEYEVSKINTAIHQMLSGGVPANHPWVLALQRAVAECDDVAYKKLINQ